MLNAEPITTEAITREYTWERVYPLPNGEAYKAVNAAVAFAISVMSRGRDPVRDDTAGYTKYTICSLDGIDFQLYVMYVSDRFANVRLNPIIPANPADFAVWAPYFLGSPNTFGQIKRLFEICHEQIAIQLRRAVTLDECDPPPPPKSDIDALLTWQEVYRPTMKDLELASIAGMEVQSIRNARNRLNHIKRVERGKPQRK